MGKKEKEERKKEKGNKKYTPREKEKRRPVAKNGITQVHVRERTGRQDSCTLCCVRGKLRLDWRDRERGGGKGGEREREDGKSFAAIVMACAMVPMCQPPQQLRPLYTAVKYAETNTLLARVKLVVIAQIDIRANR